MRLRNMWNEEYGKEIEDLKVGDKVHIYYARTGMRLFHTKQWMHCHVGYIVRINRVTVSVRLIDTEPEMVVRVDYCDLEKEK